MGESLLDEIIALEETIQAELNAERKGLHQGLEVRQKILEERYADHLQRLNIHYREIYRLLLENMRSRIAAQRASLEKRIEHEKSLPESIGRDILKDLIRDELRRHSDDYQNVKS